MARTALERTLASRIGMHTTLARKSLDPFAAVATKAEIDEYERLADPEGKYLPEERRRRAWHLYQADQTRLQLAALKAKREAGNSESVDA